MEKDKRIDLLLVEDSMDDGEFATYAMEAGNSRLKFLRIKDGHEAMGYIFSKLTAGEQITRQDLKVILLDLKSPAIDGLDILRKIRADERTRMIPVVILSNEKTDVAEAYELGVNSYVVKPTEAGKYVKALGVISSYWSAVNQNPYAEI